MVMNVSQQCLLARGYTHPCYLFQLPYTSSDKLITMRNSVYNLPDS